MKALNGFLVTQRQMTSKDECRCVMLVNFIRRVFRMLSWVILSIRLDYSRVVQFANLRGSIHCTIS